MLCLDMSCHYIYTLVMIIRKPDYDLEYCADNDLEGITSKDIVNVLAQVPGEADALDWHWIVKLRTGEFAYIWGGCDYSGWGCQDWGDYKKESTALKAARLAPEKEDSYLDNPANIRQQLISQLKGKQPYGLRNT